MADTAGQRAQRDAREPSGPGGGAPRQQAVHSGGPCAAAGPHVGTGWAPPARPASDTAFPEPGLGQPSSAQQRQGGAPLDPISLNALQRAAVARQQGAEERLRGQGAPPALQRADQDAQQRPPGQPTPEAAAAGPCARRLSASARASSSPGCWPARHEAVSACRALPGDALLSVLELLPPNEIACTARLLCKQAASTFSSPQDRAVRLSQPLPQHARAWELDDADAVSQLSFKGKLGLLSMAAASGCEVNLEVAWRLVGWSFFDNFSYAGQYSDALPDPGTAAVRAGHAHLLPWMVPDPRCTRYLVDQARTLEAVAYHCDLATLQRAWALPWAQAVTGMGGVVRAAARSRTPDALRKQQWLQQQGISVSGPSVQYLAGTRAGRSSDAYQYERAAAEGDLGRVRQLLADGSPVRGRRVAHVLASSWPVRGTPGCRAHVEEDCLAAVQEVLGAGAVLDEDLVRAAARRGSLPLVQWLVEERGCVLPWDALACAAEGGSAAVVEWLVDWGVDERNDEGQEYLAPARHGDRATLNLLQQLHVPWYGDDFRTREVMCLELDVLEWFRDSRLRLHLVVLREEAECEEDERRRDVLWDYYFDIGGR